MPTRSTRPALKKIDAKIDRLIVAEEKLQRDTVRLIPSENYVSRAVLQATGTMLTNKYSEGYPHKRYYEGQQVIDQIEDLARERACALFGADHANVQPYSGSPANLAAYLALIKPGDTIMGMALPHGGHLTHGFAVSITGKIFRSVSYGVDPDTLWMDYDAIAALARKEKPRLIVAGATAYPRQIDFVRFGEIAREVGAFLVADISHIAGLVAAGEHQSPVGIADIVTTTTHKTLRGPRGAMILVKKEHADAVDRAVFPGLQGGPHNHTTAGIAVALKEASSAAYKRYARQVVRNARALGEALVERGFVLVTGGTDNHLLLMDVMKSRGIAGKPLAQALDRAGIVANFNTVPFDSRKPFDPSGLRLGSPAVTSRGFREREMRQIAGWIDEVAGLVASGQVSAARLAKIRRQVERLCQGFPCPGLD